jgi:arylsulfatase A-like enzyme
VFANPDKAPSRIAYLPYTEPNA